MALYSFNVNFDDDTTVKVDVREADLLRVEELDPDLAKDLALIKQRQAEFGEDWNPVTPRRGYLMCFTALQRMRRQGKLDVAVPETLDEFWDSVESIEAIAPEEDSGKSSRQVLSPGS